MKSYEYRMEWRKKKSDDSNYAAVSSIMLAMRCFGVSHAIRYSSVGNMDTCTYVHTMLIEDLSFKGPYLNFLESN